MATKPTRFAPAERASAEELGRQAAAVAGQTLLQEVLATLPDLLLVLNAQRQVVYANHALAEHLGLVDDPVGQRPGEILGCVNAANETGGCGTTRACRTCGVVKTILTAVAGQESRGEARLTLSSGASLDLGVKTSPVRIGGENLIVLTLKDIADEKRREALEQVFFHDVMNTAWGVQGLAGLLRQDPSQAGAIAEMIESSASQLVDEIQAQKLLISAEEGDYRPERTAVSPARVVRDVVATFAPMGQSGEVEVMAGTDLPDSTFQTDRTLLTRVLGNLVKNAVEASEPGMTVVAGARLLEKEVEFRVYSQTVIPEDVRHQIFQRSFSTKGPGRGLGTYSVRLFTENYLGGKVDFESGEEVGTVFSVRLPLED